MISSVVRSWVDEVRTWHGCYSRKGELLEDECDPGHPSGRSEEAMNGEGPDRRNERLRTCM